MSDFNLRALIRAVCDESDETDPAMLAKEVDRRIERVDRDAALSQALPSVVGQFVSRDRSPLNVEPVAGPVAAMSGRSSKVAGIRGVARALMDRVCVGTDPSQWKRLVDCTVDDLVFVVAARREHAAAVLARAAQYERLREHLVAHNAPTVGQLPPTILNDEFGDDDPEDGE